MSEVFATGIQMGESPRWHDGRFWMCDWVAGEVLVFDADANREVVARVGGMPFSIDWLPDGSSRQVADDVWFPNGMVVLGEDTLVLAESHADRLTAWTITESGELVDRRVWADLGPGSAPDGICADAKGAIWYASVPGQRCTRVAAGGEVLETVGADRGCFACMLGGDDGRTLYIVANHYTGGDASDGVVLIQPVAVPRAGRP